MELYLQLGHGMQTLSQELIKSWGKGNVIISPVNLQQDKLASFANKIHTCGGQVLFDPQMFYPKEGHIKLQAYDYWPSRGISITSQNGYETINRELLRINNEINSSHIILPGIEMQENQFHYGLDCMNQSAAYLSQKTDKPLLATLCLYPETIRNPIAIEGLVEQLKIIPVDGYYIIPHPSNNEYIVSDPSWVIGALKLFTCIKLAKKQVYVYFLLTIYILSAFIMQKLFHLPINVTKICPPARYFHLRTVHLRAISSNIYSPPLLAIQPNR